MDANGQPNLAEEIAGALAWWREAGVDGDFTDEPQSWLARADEPEPEPASAVPSEAAPPVLAPRALPASLPEFAAWWLSDTALDHAGPAGRVPPRGQSGAKAMVLVATPERADGDHLLSGPQGNLLDAMVKALGWAPEDVYVASVLPAFDPVPDWPALAREGYGSIALQHLSLVGPERVLIFGSNVSSLLGHDAARNHGFLPDVNHDGRTFPVLLDMDLAALLAQPRRKAGLWNRLLDWMGSSDA